MPGNNRSMNHSTMHSITRLHTKLPRRPHPVGLGFAAFLAQAVLAGPADAGNPALPPQASTANHGSFEVLKKDFKSGPEVTAACLTCHTEAARQMMKTTHWTVASADGWRCRRYQTSDRQRRGSHQQFLPRPGLERTSLHQLPRRLRMDQQEL